MIRERKQIEVLFTYAEGKKLYRGVHGIQRNDFRMECKSVTAKQWKAFMWTGSREGLAEYEVKAGK